MSHTKLVGAQLHTLHFSLHIVRRALYIRVPRCKALKAFIKIFKVLGNFVMYLKCFSV